MRRIPSLRPCVISHGYCPSKDKTTRNRLLELVPVFPILFTEKEKTKTNKQTSHRYHHDVRKIRKKKRREKSHVHHNIPITSYPITRHTEDSPQDSPATKKEKKNHNTQPSPASPRHKCTHQAKVPPPPPPPPPLPTTPTPPSLLYADRHASSLKPSKDW